MLCLGGPRLGVVKYLGAWGANGAACDVGVDFVVYVHLKCGEESVHSIVVAVVSTAWDAAVNTETEEGEAKVWDVVHVVDENENFISPNLYGNGATAGDEDLAVDG
jgi:hypothetical protein